MRFSRTNFGPRSPGTVLTLLYRLAAQSAAGPRALAQPLGGMGAVSDSLARAAAAAGATIRTDAPVSRVLVDNDPACGVLLDSGERIAARTVISSADPKTSLLQLLGAEHLDTGFVRRVSHLRTQGLTAKLHLALDSAPRFTGQDEAALGGRLLLAPSLDYIEVPSITASTASTRPPRPSRLPCRRCVILHWLPREDT